MPFDGYDLIISRSDHDVEVENGVTAVGQDESRRHAIGAAGCVREFVWLHDERGVVVPSRSSLNCASHMFDKVVCISQLDDNTMVLVVLEPSPWDVDGLRPPFVSAVIDIQVLSLRRRRCNR